MSTSAVATGSRTRWRDRGAGALLGPRFARRLTLSHAVDDFADAMINLSLAGSLFFSVSLDASRSRILLYLLLTALPLAIAAPFVGPALDRSRIGHRTMIAGSQLARAAVSLALIGSLLSVVLYPLAFLVLVSRKVYGLARISLLTQMTDDRDEFLRADAHITRAGTVVGGLGVVVAGFLLAAERTTLMLSIAAPLLLAAGLISTRLPRPTPAPVALTSGAPLRDVVPGPVWRATIAVTAIRAAAGALTYLLAFQIKRGGDQWIFAAGLLAAGAGALLATFIAPRLHRPLEPDGVLVMALLVPGVVTTIGVITVGNVGVLAIAFAIGLGNGVATRSIAVLQTTVPDLARTRTIARSELMFQLATLIGAGLAVQLAPAPRPGLAVAALVLIAAGLAYARLTWRSLHQQASRLMLGDQAPAVRRALPHALLEEAGRLASLGAHRMAIVVADNAVQIARQRDATLPDEPGWDRLAAAIDGVKHDDDQPDAELVVAVLRQAEQVVGDRTPTLRSRDRTRRRVP